MSDHVDHNDPQRKAALARIKKQRAFWQYVAVWVAVSILMTIIWLLSGRGYFWPVWVMAGMGIGTIFMGIDAFGPRVGPPSEERIQREMDKM